MHTKLAIIDLGTNTFHLLVVQLQNDGSFKVLHKEKIIVKLGEFGLVQFNQQVIQRAVETLKTYKTIVDKLKVDDVFIFGTAALRMSANTDELIETIQQACGWKPEVISGLKEATLIYHGVKQTLNLGDSIHLIMDIGGGSVEFILADSDHVRWSESFNIGASLLLREFHKSEPIVKTEIQQLLSYLDKILDPLKKAVHKFPTNKLIGASGSFDTLADMSRVLQDSKEATLLSIEDFNRIYKDLISKNHEERLNTPNLVNQRADMIVVSLILIQYVLKEFNIQFLYKSDYALKEGILWAYQHQPTLIESQKTNLS